jgi:hypothetical protein
MAKHIIHLNCFDPFLLGDIERCRFFYALDLASNKRTPVVFSTVQDHLGIDLQTIDLE